MASCFENSSPIGAINAGIIAVFGDNFAPPFNPDFQPRNLPSMSLEPLLTLDLPGGITIPPAPNLDGQSISSYFPPVIATMGMVTAFMKPIFDILQLIIGIINVICTLVDPVKIIQAVTALLLQYIPPILAYLPPFAALLMALDVIKVAIAMLVSILSAIIPIVEDLVANAIAVNDAITAGNEAAAKQIEIKVCLMIKNLANQLGILGPLQIIIDTINELLKLGSEGFCGSGGDSDCCNGCPALVTNPPAGNGRILSVIGNVVIIQVFTALAQTNQYGIVRNVPVFSQYEVSRPFNPLSLIPGFVVEGEDPMGTYLSDLSEFLIEGEPLFLANIDNVSGPITASSISDDKLIITATMDGFTLADTGRVISYSITANEMSLMTNMILNVGCNSEVSAASEKAGRDMDIDSLAYQTNQNNQIEGFALPAAQFGLDPAGNKIGGLISRINIEALNDCLTQLEADPTNIGILDCFVSNLQREIGNKQIEADKVLCAAASSTNSTISSDKTTAFIQDDLITLTFAVKDRSGGLLMKNAPPNTGSSVVFNTTLGEISAVTLDSTTGLFHATISSSIPGPAIVSGYFVTTDVCMQPRDGDTLALETITLEFIPNDNKTRRQERQYVQSKGGRRR